MNISEWLIFLLIIQAIHFAGTWKLYIKAGKKSWEAIIPIYSAIVFMEIINRPKWWVILLYVPIINLLIFPVVWVESARSFGKNSRIDTLLAIITLGFYNYYLNYIADVNYVENRDLKAPTELGDWVSSIVFAIVAATLVHTYFMQPYTIPTSSLEKSLLVGDFLFVSKFHYGARTPMTPIAAPMVHDSIPLTKFKSYLSKPQLPYFRIPGFQDIKRNEIVVFNWPTDTVRFFRDRSNIHIDKPIDKKSNYVKRCVAVPGDSLEIKDGFIFINGERTVLPDRAKPQYSYRVITSKEFSYLSFKSRYGVTDGVSGQREAYLVNLTEENVKRLKNNPFVKKVERIIIPNGKYDSSIFPHDPEYSWSIDNFGPIYIPEEGKTVDLNSKSLPFYKRIIEEYENNNLTINEDEIYINGKLSTTYTFKQNYYWMMGDNRHNSEDARFWGYVPFDHVVGKPVFIWMSWDTNGKGLSKIRWERLFTTVHGSGKPVSYFYYFLGVLALWIVFSNVRKRRKISE